MKSKMHYMQTFSRPTTLLACALFALIGCAESDGSRSINAQRLSGRAPSDTRHAANSIARLKIGMSEGEITTAIHDEYSLVHTDRNIDKFPFVSLLPYTNLIVTAEWTRALGMSNEKPVILFCIFADESKSYLTDALLYDNGQIFPVVDGTYNRALRAIRKGESVREVYRMLGKRQGEYYLGSDNKWCVKLIYFGFSGRTFDVIVDAATGLVISSDDITI